MPLALIGHRVPMYMYMLEGRLLYSESTPCPCPCILVQPVLEGLLAGVTALMRECVWLKQLAALL